MTKYNIEDIDGTRICLTHGSDLIIKESVFHLTTHFKHGALVEVTLLKSLVVTEPTELEGDGRISKQCHIENHKTYVNMTHIIRFNRKKLMFATEKESTL